jgi:hypothetical protein
LRIEECRVVSVTNPYGHILGLLVRSRYSFFQVAPQLYPRGWVDPVPDQIILKKNLVAPGIEPGPLALIFFNSFIRNQNYSDSIT